MFENICAKFKERVEIERAAKAADDLREAERLALHNKYLDELYPVLQELDGLHVDLEEQDGPKRFLVSTKIQIGRTKDEIELRFVICEKNYLVNLFTGEQVSCKIRIGFSYEDMTHNGMVPIYSMSGTGAMRCYASCGINEFYSVLGNNIIRHARKITCKND